MAAPAAARRDVTRREIESRLFRLPESDEKALAERLLDTGSLFAALAATERAEHAARAA